MSRNRKVFQILHGFCYWDATPTVGTVETAYERFAPTMRFVDAPWYVREGWGFNDELEGDDKFVQPEPPEGWGYDLEKGVFYPLEGTVVEIPELPEIPDMSVLIEDREVEVEENDAGEGDDK